MAPRNTAALADAGVKKKKGLSARKPNDQASSSTTAGTAEKTTGRKRSAPETLTYDHSEDNNKENLNLDDALIKRPVGSRDIGVTLSDKYSHPTYNWDDPQVSYAVALTLTLTLFSGLPRGAFRTLQLGTQQP